MNFNYIFVFGSNEAGRHGRGAALHAFRYHGAKYKQGVGLQGLSYAIPTKDKYLRTLSINKIKKYIDDFILFARIRPYTIFHVTELGTGLAGLSHEEIAPLFSNIPNNVLISEKWRKINEEATK